MSEELDDIAAERGKIIAEEQADERKLWLGIEPWLIALWVAVIIFGVIELIAFSLK